MQAIKMIRLTKVIFPMPSLMSVTLRVVFGTFPMFFFFNFNNRPAVTAYIRWPTAAIQK